MIAVAQKDKAPWLALAGVLLATTAALVQQGRYWICTCGRVLLWTSDTWSADNSQHISDPYSFSHIEHGLIFYVALTWAFPNMSLLWRLVLATLIESIWEVFENTEFVIQRYREVTAALGYQGDTIINSLGDVGFCILGFALAYYLGFRRSLILFIIIEIGLLLFIRDSLILNVLMLLYPIEAIRAWQTG
jgi:hypothetical protein